jgi:murein L,D-transpeptidase YcbB/YkuD
MRVIFAGLRLVFGTWPGRPSLGRTLPAAVVAVFALMAWTGEAPGQADAVGVAIRARCEQMVRTGSLRVAASEIAAVVAIPRFYQARGYAPAWDYPGDIQDLVAAASGMHADGLNPEDYHFTALTRVSGEMDETSPPDPELEADREVLFTDALLRILYHAEYGKVDPELLDPNWNIHKEFRTDEVVASVSEVLGSGGLHEYIEAAKPQHHLYSCLKNTLARYREIQAAGGWEQVDDSKVLKLGVVNDAVAALRRRLAVTGDLPPEAPTASTEFDGELEEAVKYFQNRHGLAADGVVGKASFEALNMPVEDRVDRLRVNLERGRWVLQDFNDTFVLVNIAGFQVYYAVENKMTWRGKAQVGKTYRQTPVFKAEMEYLVFNPTWTVPPTILAKDVLPAIQEDAGYLASKNMLVLDRSGKTVDPGGIAWSKYQGSNFPYVIRQEPGPDNALGQVKFIFPNKHFVFLHDTPSKSLFERAERTFSSGCIRVENPLELAEILLADKGYDQARIVQVLESGKLENVYLTRPVPTLLLYWTAFTTLEGECNFRKDVYERDPRIIEALDGPIMARKGHQAERDRMIKELRDNQ